MTWYFYAVNDDWGHSPKGRGKTHRSATLKGALAKAYQMAKYEYAEEVHVTNRVDQTGTRRTASWEFKPYNVPYVVYDNSPRERPLSLIVVQTKKGIKRLMADGSMRELK